MLYENCESMNPWRNEHSQCSLQTLCLLMSHQDFVVVMSQHCTLQNTQLGHGCENTGRATVTTQGALPVRACTN